jgi:kynurenine formamidase
LADRKVRLVGTDCLGIDGSSTNDLGSHFVLLGNGILIVENLKNLDKVPSPFLLITLPLKIKEGTGSPIWAVGLFY